MNKRLLITLTTAFCLLAATVIIIRLAEGYRPEIENGHLKSTGLLLANSTPEGAQVLINDELKTATDDTMNLAPGEYQVRIEKAGYHPWRKLLTIQAELVTETNAHLFPAVTELKPLTVTGAKNPQLSPDNSKIFFESQGEFWVLEMNNSPFGNPKPKKISQLEREKEIKRLKLEKKAEEEIQFTKFPLDFQKVASGSSQLIAFSPDETKLLYLAEANVAVPSGLVTPLLSTSTQTEEREIRANVIYVYDRKEDKNFRIHEAVAPIAWLADSRHLLFSAEAKIKAVEFDGQNETIIYAGSFENDFFAVWPDGSRLVILANLTPGSELPPNLYSLNLR